MSAIIKQLNKELDRLSKVPDNIKDYSRFQKGGAECLSFPTPFLRKISAEWFKKVKDCDKKEIFSFCEELLKTEKMGRKLIAFDWAFRIKKKYSKSDFKIFESWVKNYVNSWDSCDDLCTRAFGEFLYQFPELIEKTKKWAKSKNMWFRRVSAVALIYLVRREKALDDIFEVSDILLQDEEYLVQKGYGWALKEASNVYPKKVFDFVMKRKDKMPRTALRYAIEKMPKEWKERAMLR